MIWTPHTTVAAVVERDQHYLMIEETIHGQLMLNQPAGHLEDNESLLNAVIRETREESAWRFHPQALIKIYRWRHPQGHTYLRFAFTGHVDNHRPEQILDTGIQRTLWMTYKDIVTQSKRLRSPLVLRCIDDYQNGCRLPLSTLANIE